MLYKVTKQYGRGSETTFGEFNTLNEARRVIREKMMEDAGMGVRATYRIYESYEMIEEYDPTKGQVPGAAAGEEQNQTDVSGSGGKGQGASFRPTPLNSSPRPPGMPHHWLKDDEEDDSGKEK